MSRIFLRAFGALILLSMLFAPPAASAHETIIAGDYEIEYGWLAEPPVAGQPNAITLSIRRVESHSETSGSIALAAPAAGATIHGDHVEVEVTFEGVDHHAEGQHWHLYLDDQILSMLPLEQSAVTVTGLSNGTHTLRALLSDSTHADVGTPATVTFTVEGSTASGAPAVEGTEASGEATHSHEAAEEVDVSGLKIEIVYGPETKTLTLQPLGEDTPGQFMAQVTPTRAGAYTVRLSGKIGDSDVNVEVKPEEVESAAVVQFPSVAEMPAATNTFGLVGWLAVAGVVLGIIGVGLGALSLRKK